FNQRFESRVQASDIRARALGVGDRSAPHDFPGHMILAQGRALMVCTLRQKGIAVCELRNSGQKPAFSVLQFSHMQKVYIGVHKMYSLLAPVTANHKKTRVAARGRSRAFRML